MSACIIIPARLKSSRFPEKVLAQETGKYLIQHVYEQALKAAQADEVWIATDHARVLEAVHAFHGQAVMTSPAHPSGTDRIAEVAKTLDHDIIINLQGDEPEISPEVLDALVSELTDNPQAAMATLAAPIRSGEALHNPSVVKVVVDKYGYALYFSRQPIPDTSRGTAYRHLRHIGIYGFRKDFLMEFVSLPPSKLEQCECLEQLRALENGYAIKVLRVDDGYGGIDTREQYQDFVARYMKRHE